MSGQVSVALSIQFILIQLLRRVSIILIVFLLLMTAGIYDCRYSKIPNWLTASGYLFGLVFLYIKQPEKIVTRIMTSLIIMFMLYAFFAVGQLGAGDIKLLMMLSIYMDIQDYIRVTVGALIVSVIIGMVKVFINKSKTHLLHITVHLAIPIFASFCGWSIYHEIGGLII